MSLAQQKGALFGKAAAGSKTAVAGAANPTSTLPPPPGRTAGVTFKATTVGQGGSLGMSNEQKEKKMKEARELSEQGMKHLKTSMMQWKPDHLAAAPCFEKAANLYILVGETKLARATLLEAVSSNEQAGVHSGAALGLLKASDLAKQLGEPVEAAEHLKRGAELYGIGGDVEKCADFYSKAARALEDTKRKKEARELYAKAVEMLVPADMPTEAYDKLPVAVVELTKSAFRFLVHCDKHEKAIKLGAKMVKVFEALDLEVAMCGSMCSIVLLHLKQGDVVKANDALLEFFANSTFLKSKECALADTFVSALRGYDIEKLEEAKASRDLQMLDRDMQYIARQLTLSDTGDLEQQGEARAAEVADDIADMMKMANFKNNKLKGAAGEELDELEVAEEEEVAVLEEEGDSPSPQVPDEGDVDVC